MKRARLAAAALVLSVGSCVAPPRGPSPVPPPAPPVARPAPPSAAAITLEGLARQGGIMTGMAPHGTVALTLDGAAVPLTAAGRFLIAFDRDAATSARLTATLAEGGTVSRVVTIAPGDWFIERVDASPTGGRTTAEFQRLRPAELARINAARMRTTEADGWRQRFVWPATGRVSGRFGSQRIYRGEPGSYHSGVDVAVPTGTPVVAPADGVVILAAERPFTLEGNLLMIDHGMGLNSAFLHLSAITVREGEPVRRGQLVARAGATGRASGPHLHWGMKWRAARIDPALLAGAMPAH